VGYLYATRTGALHVTDSRGVAGLRRSCLVVEAGKLASVASTKGSSPMSDSVPPERYIPPKRYDRAYFDRWYRGDDPAVGTEADLERAVALAVAATESVLARPVRSVLDVGCGEGRWQPVLRRLRPRASYLGIDPSRYAVDRFGTRRNLRSGRLAELAYHVFDEPFDLVVCSDVLHYLAADEIRIGLPALAERTGGLAVIDVFCAEDQPEGDRDGLHLRSSSWYRGVLREAGLVPVGLQMYVPHDLAEDLEALDIPP